VLLRTGEGNWMNVSYARTNSWGSRRKVFDFSTPALEESSLIEKAYLCGDQRKWFVSCVHCNHQQEQLFKSLYPDTKAGILQQVVYICEKCGVELYEYDKPALGKSGIWLPTAISESPELRSYQISSLASPQGMLSWKELYQIYLKAVDDPDEMRSFVNLYLGKAFKEAGSRPKLENVIALRGGYNSKEVPEGVLYLTIAIDVQSGSKTDKTNPARIELEVLGHGMRYKTFSIEYKRIEGAIDDAHGGAWEELNQYAMDTGLVYRRKNGLEFAPSMVFVDSGDGNFTDVVYTFCQRWANTFPIKGFSSIKNSKKDKEKGDIQSINNFRRYKQKKISEDIILYEISTNYYKTSIYRNLKIPRQEIEDQKAGFCDFPRDYGEKYFKMLTAEEKRKDGSFHNTTGRRNEALDIRVYNLCASDVYLNSLVMRYRAIAKQKGATDIQLQDINQKYVLNIMHDQILQATLKLRN
jgi:phage terminase large subunit GpA-like protein